jgi:ribulose 1,5-bisphosphate synthetase/thiazole synthase
MKKLVQLIVIVILFCLAFVHSGFVKASPKREVNESARNIPVAYDVDVVVVGGTSGGVAAAVEAAQRGAKVFLAAQRPYLGADLCGTYRLWLEPGEEPTSPLAKKVFARLPSSVLDPKGIRFTYEADRPSAGVHKDTAEPSLLTDGKWQSASTQSVQYNGDVTITADLLKEHRLKRVYLMVYQRRNSSLADDFEVDSVIVSVSSNRQSWKKIATISNKRVGEALNQPWGPIKLVAPVSGRARYVKLLVKKSRDVSRVLLGEIVIEAEHSSTESAQIQSVPIVVTPMHVKRTLDEALLGAEVQFLYGCYATDVLRDGDGKVAGIVMANRSGRQAVRAKIVIDATPRASVARMAGATFEPYLGGLQNFRRIVVGGEVRTGKNIQARKVPTPILAKGGLGYEAIEYTLKIPMKDSSFASFAQAEQIARDKTWHPGQADASETLFQVPPDPMKGKKTLAGAWPGAEKVELDVFQPGGINRLFVVGGCADISREAAGRLLRPLELMKLGSRIGAAAASEAKSMPRPDNITLYGKPVAGVTAGDVRENLSEIHRTLTEPLKVPADKRAVPILGEVDVVVVGGGTGGAPAGISAARQGAKTLVLEYLHGLGGVGTMGLISKYYYGYIKGFTKEIDGGMVGDGISNGRKNGIAVNCVRPARTSGSACSVVARLLKTDASKAWLSQHPKGAV